MATFTPSELDMMSRALERALTGLPGKPRSDITTADLAESIIQAATAGLRDEEILAERALARVLGR